MTTATARKPRAIMIVSASFSSEEKKEPYFPSKRWMSNKYYYFRVNLIISNARYAHINRRMQKLFRPYRPKTNVRAFSSRGKRKYSLKNFTEANGKKKVTIKLSPGLLKKKKEKKERREKGIVLSHLCSTIHSSSLGIPY